MRNKNIKDVFFDLDHTLWDFDKNSELTFESIFNRNHPTIEIAAFIEKYVPINQACWKLYQYDKITHAELRYNRLKHSFDALNYTISDEQIEEWKQVALDGGIISSPCPYKITDAVTIGPKKIACDQL